MMDRLPYHELMLQRYGRYEQWCLDAAQCHEDIMTFKMPTPEDVAFTSIVHANGYVLKDVKDALPGCAYIVTRRGPQDDGAIEAILRSTLEKRLVGAVFVSDAVHDYDADVHTTTLPYVRGAAKAFGDVKLHCNGAPALRQQITEYKSRLAAATDDADSLRAHIAYATWQAGTLWTGSSLMQSLACETPRALQVCETDVAHLVAGLVDGEQCSYAIAVPRA